jgi:hypothetical protein
MKRLPLFAPSATMSLDRKPILKVDWATHEAALYACKNWHYSKAIPSSKLVKIGVWENDKYIGVVIFSCGATPHLMSPFGLKMTEGCELTRIALTRHITPVSKIISIALRFLKKSNPGLRLVVSYADVDQSHHGGIYQATNWIYIGLMNTGVRSAFIVNGKKIHPRTIGSNGGTQSLEWIRKNLDSKASEFITKGKHKYIFPLDKYIRKKLIDLSKPYPKRDDS